MTGLGFRRWVLAIRRIAPDVKRYQLEQGPLGEKLFRTNFGAYKDGDLSNGNFSEFADARSLKSFNTKFISRDRHHAQPGDLLFFYQPWVQKFPVPRDGVSRRLQTQRGKIKRLGRLSHRRVANG